MSCGIPIIFSIGGASQLSFAANRLDKELSVEESARLIVPMEQVDPDQDVYEGEELVERIGSEVESDDADGLTLADHQ